MEKESEAFCDLRGRLTTSTGKPYTELFSTEEIRRLSFMRFLAEQQQEPSAVLAEEKASAQSGPADDLFTTATACMTSWFLLGLELFYSPPLIMATIMTDYCRMLLRVTGCEDIP